MQKPTCSRQGLHATWWTHHQSSHAATSCASKCASQKMSHVSQCTAAGFGDDDPQRKADTTSAMGAQPRVAIVGAGIAGSACAAHLARAGVAVTIADLGRAPGRRCACEKHQRCCVACMLLIETLKQRIWLPFALSLISTGGRASSRHLHPGTADHGAQVIGPPVSSAFAEVLDHWKARGLVQPWQGQFGVLVPGPAGGFTPSPPASNPPGVSNVRSQQQAGTAAEGSGSAGVNTATSPLLRFLSRGQPLTGALHVAVPSMGSLAAGILSEFASPSASASASAGTASTLPLIELKTGTRVVSAHLERPSGRGGPVWKLAAAPSRGGGDSPTPLGEFAALVVTDSLVAKPGRYSEQWKPDVHSWHFVYRAKEAALPWKQKQR
jgi:hypothetical protein